MEKIDGYRKLIAAVTIREVKTVILNAQDMVKIDEMLNNITVKEATVIRRYYGLDGVAEKQREIGMDLSVTPVRIGQILNKATRKLRHPSRIKAFEKCTEDKRVQILEENNKNQAEEIARLRDGVKNAIRLLKSLIPPEIF